MVYRNVRLGDYIRIRSERNTDSKYGFESVMGVSQEKEIIKTKAKQGGNDISKFFVVYPKDFVFSTRGGVAVALNDSNETFIISFNNTCFYVDSDDLLPEYLRIFFRREQYDRYARFYAWGSSTELFGWEELCDMIIPLPPVEKQREYVAVYDNLLTLSKNHEKSFEELQKLTDSFMDAMSEKYEMRELREYVEQTDKRNRDLSCDRVQGISIQKKFIDSKANMDGVPLGGYKIVEPLEFAYVTVTSRNGNKISIALNESEKLIVSGTYITFKTLPELLPEYLLLWFKRPEFDRYARFNSWGSARETFDWDEMKRVKVPIPPLEVQKSIVAIHHALEARKQLNARVRALVMESSPVLIKNAKDLCCSEN